MNASQIVGYEKASNAEALAAVAVGDTSTALSGECLKGADLVNTGSETIYLCGSVGTVSSAVGYPILANGTYRPPPFVTDLSVYTVICAAGKASTLRILVYR